MIDFITSFADLVEVSTILAIATAIASVWVFLRRYREEARKARVAHLETMSLEQLFRFRRQLVFLSRHL